MAEAQTKKKTTKSPNSSCKKYNDRNMESRNKARKLKTHAHHLAMAKARGIRNAEIRAEGKKTERSKIRALNKVRGPGHKLVDLLLVPHKPIVVVEKPKAVEVVEA